MFTGLVRAIGTLHPLSANSMRIDCRAIAAALPNLELGDSVAVDGVCLTVTKILPQGFIADISPETLDRTTLGKQSEGSQAESAYVNLEPSLQVGSKIGGHFVTGHIDGTGNLESTNQTEIAWEMCFRVGDARVARYIVPKGSIAVNGVSLTVADCTPTGDWFKVAVIPLTYTETNLRYLQPGSLVNLEGDVLGKYVEKFLRLGAGSAAIADLEALIQPSGDLTPAFLAEHGYL